MKKVVTVEEYDGKGNLIKRTITTEEEADTQPITYPNYRWYPNWCSPINDWINYLPLDTYPDPNTDGTTKTTKECNQFNDTKIHFDT